MATYDISRSAIGFDVDDDDVPPVVVSVSPTSATISASATQQFTATVSGGVDASTSGVTWSVEGGAGNGSVNGSGLYTAPSSPGAYFVVATSVEDPTISYRAAVVIMQVPDSTAPVVTLVSPADGSTIQTTTKLVLDVTDNLGALRRVIIHAEFQSRGIKEVVHDGDNWGPHYATADNLRQTISGGHRYTLLRRGGWIASPVITAHAIDTAGNEAS